MSRWNNLKGSNKYFFPYSTYYDKYGNKYKTGSSFFMNPYYGNQILRQPRQYNPWPSWVKDPTPTPTPFPTPSPTPYPTASPFPPPTQSPYPTTSPWPIPTQSPFPTMSNTPTSTPNQKLFNSLILSNPIPANFKLLEYDPLEHDFNDFFSNWFNNWNGKEYFNLSHYNFVLLNSFYNIGIDPKIIVNIESDVLSILDSYNFISFAPYLDYNQQSNSVIYVTLAKIPQIPDPQIESITFEIDSSCTLHIATKENIALTSSITIFN